VELLSIRVYTAFPLSTIRGELQKEEQIKISNNALRAKVSLAKEGMPISKIPPFGYDKKYLDAAGGHRWTVHVLTASRRRGGTRYLTVMADGNRYEMDVPYRKNKSDRVVYVPTEIAPDRIQAVQYAFRTFAAESITVAKLAVRMNRLGFTIYGKPWLKTTLEGILRNPAYAGDVRLNNVSRGEFTVYDGTKLVPATNPDRKIVRNPAERQILTPDRHEPLIDRDTWKLVQEKLATRRGRPAPPKRDDLWLRGLLVCGGCGKVMHTWCQGKSTRGYICASYYRFQQTRSPQEDTGCGRNWVSHEDAERLIQDHLGEAEVETTDRVSVDRLNGVIDELFGAKVEVLKAIRRAVHEYLTELNAVFAAGEAGREFSRLLAEAAKAHRPVRDTELAREIERMAEGVFSPDEARDLFVVFEDGKVQLAREKVAGLKEEYDRWLSLKARPDSDREFEAAREKCRKLEGELDVWEARMRPVDERVAELQTRLQGRRRQVSEASEALKGGSNRRKAEVVRGLFTRVVLHFRREKKARQSRTTLLPDQTEFEVNPMDVTSPRSCRRSRATATRGRRPRRGFRSRSRRS
jgi:hypothetical protein